MSDHEFTTAEVREAFVEYQHDFIDVDAWGFAGDWFNRWFAGELEKARADEREKAAQRVEALRDPSIPIPTIAMAVAAARGEDAK